jgi:hypothetical protein
VDCLIVALKGSSLASTELWLLVGLNATGRSGRFRRSRPATRNEIKKYRCEITPPPYNLHMAKGWESKGVESQVQDSQSKNRGKHGEPMTATQVDTRRRKEVLFLSRARVERDLQQSQDQRYRDLLTRALSDLDAQLTALDKIV